jgi:hypothetical protein
MTTRAARRLLWLGSLVALPVPILLLGPGLVPPARLAELGAISLAVAVVESARGNVLQVAAVFLVQAAVWTSVLWIAAWLAARALARLGPRVLRSATLAALAVGLAVACALPVYRTPFAARAPRANLLHVYE